jgi:hypothetical protein
MKLLISTQVFENYGAHDWNGEGECPQNWKAKLGDDYEVATFSAEQANDREFICGLVEKARVAVARSDFFFRRCLIGYDIVADDYLTDFERDQLDYEGHITFPRSIINLDASYNLALDR